MALNIVDIIFLFLAVTLNILGVLLNNFQKYAPVFVYRATYYGSFAYKGSEAGIIRLVEIPKSFFRHYYIFSSIFSFLALVYIILVFFFNVDVLEFVRIGLRTLLLEDEPVSVTAALTAMILLTIQCFRRLYETLFLQVFAKRSKMNIVHYIIGIIHYTLCVVSIVGITPLFCGNQTRQEITWIDIKTTITVVPCTILFVWASYEQHQSNIILANLRRSKDTGNIETEEYKIPKGRLFKYVSSPHRFCEISIYVAFLVLLQTKTFVFILLWVASNQIQGAIGVQQWYKKTFEDYPKERYAIIPYLL